jgi:hypothetical protein
VGVHVTPWATGTSFRRSIRSRCHPVCTPS